MARSGDILVNRVTGHRLRILQAAADTGGALLDMEASYPAGATRPPEHFHPRQEEHFEVLEGTMQVVLDGAPRTLAAGDTLVVPRGVRHAMWNAGPGTARVRWQTRPALRTEQMFEALYELAALGRVNAAGAPALLDLAQLLTAYRDEMRVVRPPPLVQRVALGVLAPVARALGRP